MPVSDYGFFYTVDIHWTTHSVTFAEIYEKFHCVKDQQ